MQLHQQLEPADVLLVCGSVDVRVPAYAAELYKQGLAPIVLVSGGLGKVSRNTSWNSEAEVFADVLRHDGVPKQAIILEDKATNGGENIRFSYELLRSKNMLPRSLILIHKPYMERRAYATFMQQWPAQSTKIQASSPPIDYDEYFATEAVKEQAIHLMVGDLQRIKEYPKLGYQIEQSIPTDVWKAWQRLVEASYTKHLLA
jgi:uncharacterized SAM-binding protein YcdF (DUF218 family)